MVIKELTRGARPTGWHLGHNKDRSLCVGIVGSMETLNYFIFSKPNLGLSRLGSRAIEFAKSFAISKEKTEALGPILQFT